MTWEQYLFLVFLKIITYGLAGFAIGGIIGLIVSLAELIPR